MESRARLLGHPIHQMLIVFPLGLLATAVAFDLLAIVRNEGYWSELGYWMIAAGVLMGLLAAPFGTIDWLGIPRGTRAKRIGALHGIGNVVVVLLFGCSWLLRTGLPTAPSAVALSCSFTAGALALVTGWLGGELVDRLGVGVDDGAHVDAPSTLSKKKAGA